MKRQWHGGLFKVMILMFPKLNTWPLPVEQSKVRRKKQPNWVSPSGACGGLNNSIDRIPKD